MSKEYQYIKTTAEDLKETYKNETMDKIFEDFAEALNDYQDLACESCKAQDKLEEKIEELEKALELAVADKCFAENCIAEQVVGKGATVSVPKKEQWYLEKAKEMMKSE